MRPAHIENNQQNKPMSCTCGQVLLVQLSFHTELSYLYSFHYTIFHDNTQPSAPVQKAMLKCVPTYHKPPNVSYRNKEREHCKTPPTPVQTTNSNKHVIR